MNVLVTGGGTVAPIDDVRSIANTSTGRFSAAITEACLGLGARVRHVHAPGAELPFAREARLDLDADGDAEFERLRALRARYRAARDRLRLVPLRPGTVACYAATLQRLLDAEPADLLFLAMAASDYEPEPVAGKIESDRESLVVRCRRTPKVIRLVRDWAPSAFLVGFKLLSGSRDDELIRRAEEAAALSRADATVANDLTAVREGRHEVYLVRPGHAPEHFGPAPDMPARLVGRVFELARGHAAPLP